MGLIFNRAKNQVTGEELETFFSFNFRKLEEVFGSLGITILSSSYKPLSVNVKEIEFLLLYQLPRMPLIDRKKDLSIIFRELPVEDIILEESGDYLVRVKVTFFKPLSFLGR